jgi:hypothetical protein
MMLDKFKYVVETMGSDSHSQDGGAEMYNNTLAVKVRTLLYSFGLPIKFWSAARLYVVYLHNQLVHSAINKTPYKAWYCFKPDVTHLRTFGSLYVSNAPDLDVASWIDMILPAFSLATQQPTRISATLISLSVSSKCVIMPSLARLGIFN